MQYQFSVDFVSEIVGLAQEIAFHQRGERKLQDEGPNSKDFAREREAIREALR